MTLLGPAATNYAAIIRPLQWLAVALVFLFLACRSLMSHML